MLNSKLSRVLSFLLIFAVALIWQVDRYNKSLERQAEYEQLQEKARNYDSGIDDEIVEGFLNQDWEGLVERSITQTREETEKVMGYVGEVSEKAAKGAEEAAESE